MGKNHKGSELVAEFIGVPTSKSGIFRHEDCHKYYGLYSSKDPKKEKIILTIEGGGDDSCTVSTSRNGESKSIGPQMK